MAFLDRLVPQDTPVEAIRDPVLERAGVHLSVLRLDRIHAQISGNKWFKLIRNLDSAQAQDHDTLLSFGGPWSNHLHALACAGTGAVVSGVIGAAVGNSEAARRGGGVGAASGTLSGSSGTA